jgi:ATP-dependent helicase/nuclease subunit A
MDARGGDRRVSAVRQATDAQRRAADPGHSAWVAASAGSGKTKVLTDRVLNFLLGGTAPHRILCITFTKAAAAEMSIRLGDRLRLWATQGDDAVARSLAELTGDVVHPEDEIVGRARQLFARVLDAPGGLKIQTIHSFCQSLLGRFPLEAGVVPHFELLDERGEADLLAEAREAVLLAAREGGDATLAAALAEATRHTQEQGFAELMGDLLCERGKLKRLLAAGGPDAARRRLAATLGVAEAATREAVLVAACADAAFDPVPLRRAAGALLGGSDKEQERGNIIADWLAAPVARRTAEFDRYLRAFLTDKGEIGKRLVNKGTEQAHPGTTASLEAEGERLVRACAAMRAAALLAASDALTRLGAAVLKAYEREKHLRAALDFDDLIARARALLERPGVASWVLFKLDGGIDHILVDEAQDTNFDQWAIIRQLTGEFFAGAGARAGAVRTVFAVGDPKQSIFGFQGAQPEAFDEMRGDFAGRIAAGRDGTGADSAAVRPLATVPLDVSFRSTATVLRAVDAVFGEGGPAADVWLPDPPRRHQASREGHAGLVELWPLVPRIEKEDEGAWAIPVERDAAVLPRTRLANAIARTIRRWIDQAETLPARGRSIRAGDVMVLVRRRNAFVADLVRALRQEGVPVAGVDRMRLARELAVEDLVALASFLLLPEDDLTLATVLKGPLFGLDDEDLFRLCYARRGTLWDELRGRAGEAPRWEAAVAALSELLARADFVPPYELFADLLGAGGGRRAILARLGPEAGDALDEFLALALRFERANVPSLQGFLHWLAAGEIELKRELEQRGRDEVRIMTVHGAKGLQAPVVILPDTTAAPSQMMPLRWTSDGLLLWCPNRECDAPVARAAKQAADGLQARELRRLLYVAMTRVEDRLVVAGFQNGRAEPDGCWYRLVEKGLLAESAAPVAFVDPLGQEGWAGTALRLEDEQRAAPRMRDEEASPEVAAELPDWARDRPKPEPSPPRPLSPSRPLWEDPPARSPLEGEAGAAGGVKRGLLVHRLLQALPELPAAERAEACARYLARAVHGLAPDDQEAIRRETLAVLEHPEFAPLFGPESRAEVPIVGLVGAREPIAVAGQIDRLVVLKDEVLIVDYKTLRPPPAAESGIPEAYLRQLGLYVAAVAKVWRDRPVRAALLWTDGPRLMPVSPALLAGWEP